MTATTLIKDLARLGIQLKADGERLRYSPRSAVTPDLAAQMKYHKAGLLALLRNPTDVPEIDPTNAAAVWQAALDRLEGSAPHCDPATEPDFGPPGPDGWPASCIDPDELTPCPECDTLELWQSLAGNWHCQNCDPPDKARQLRERVKRLKTASQIGPS